MHGERRSVRTILVAAGLKTTAELRQLFGDRATFVIAHTYEDSVRLFDAEQPRAVMVGYHFDLGRPYRLVRYVRSKASAHEVPIVLVRLRSAEMGSSTEEQVREAYEGLGVQRFFSVPDEPDPRRRRKALEEMRDDVLHFLGMARTRGEDRLPS
jgi:hypothetical protein